MANTLSWHNSCTLDGTKLVVSGGCADSGVLLSDAYLLDVTMEKPVWRVIPRSRTPPSRLGHSSVYDGRRILIFGGLAKGRPLRLRSSDVFTMDYWQQNYGFWTSGWNQSTSVPFDHVAVSLPGGRILIFDGSIAGLRSAALPASLICSGTQYVRRRGNKSDGPGGQTGEEWMLSELHELSLVSSTTL